MNSKILLNPWLALVTLALCVLVRYWDPQFVESVRLRYFDQLIASVAETELPIHVVNIDEATLDALGQWPFPRDQYAALIQDIARRDAGLIVWNVLMPEADRFGKDTVLAEALKSHPVYLPTVGSGRDRNLARRPQLAVIGDATGSLVEYPGLLANVPPLEQAASGGGVVNTLPEIDGVVRRMPLLVAASGTVQPSLTLDVLRGAVADTVIQARFTDAGLDRLRIPKLGQIQTDELSRIWIDYSMVAQEHSAVDLPQSFNQGIVIVGLSAAGLVNPVGTSVGEQWPQNVLASTIGTVLSGRTITRPAWSDTLELAVLLILGFMVVGLAQWRRA